MSGYQTFKRYTNRLCGLLLVAAVAGCAEPQIVSADAPDPFAPVNRAVHQFNKGADTVLIRPLSKGYVTAVPGPLRRGISNGANNLAQPLYVANHLLQGDVEAAGTAFFRFGMNTTVGLAGLLDPATEAGLADNPTDFGETLAVWGLPSGPYVELPILGPSTVRGTVGQVTEIVGDPLFFVIDDEFIAIPIAVEVGALLQTRQDFARVIDALLYESADSYNASRIAYLQNRARELNEGLALEELDLEDPFAFE
ncbi:MAG: VacJ family lipoprotein [Pseudomonadota bacterium]